MASAPEVQLVIAGPGDVDDVRKDLPASIASNVTFLGLVSDEDKARFLASVDLYVAPNTGGESFGIVLLEAMAAGTPVLASDLEAFSKVLEGGRSGGLFRSEDPVDLARHVLELLADPAARHALRESADATVARYDWETVAAARRRGLRDGDRRPARGPRGHRGSRCSAGSPG